MSQWDHERKPGYLAAWKQIGLNAKYPPPARESVRATIRRRGTAIADLFPAFLFAKQLRLLRLFLHV